MRASRIPRDGGRRGCEVAEIALLERLARSLPRSRHQLNERHESDAELVRLPGTRVILAITTDAISEEIESGLYDDPYLIGWMAVTASASDLAAVGAHPLGLLLSETLPFDAPDALLRPLQAGIADACDSVGMAVLGGDTNHSDRWQIGATAVGWVPEGAALTRRGARPGDALFASGPLGAGGAFALARLAESGGGVPGHAASQAAFRPRARIREGRLLRRFGSACMDSSDGALPTLDELMRLNGLGFDLHVEAGEALEPGARSLARRSGLPGWMLLAGPHGEFELIFTVRAPDVNAFLEAAAGIGWRPFRLGDAVERPGLRLPIRGRAASLDTTAIRNLFHEVGGDPSAYVAALRSLDRRLCGSLAAARDPEGRSPRAS